MNARVDDFTGPHSPRIPIDPTQVYIQCGWIRFDREYKRSSRSSGRRWLNADRQSLK